MTDRAKGQGWKYRHNRIDDWVDWANNCIQDLPVFMDKEFPGWETVAAEYPLMESVYRDDSLLYKGYIDAIIKVRDPKGNLRCYIIDWKTANARGWNSDKRRGAGEPYRVVGEEEMLQEIYNNGPIVAFFYVYNDFYGYKSGVYQRSQDAELDGPITVKILGWGLENGTKYWTVANNWNEEWYLRCSINQLRAHLAHVAGAMADSSRSSEERMNVASKIASTGRLLDESTDQSLCRMLDGLTGAVSFK